MLAVSTVLGTVVIYLAMLAFVGWRADGQDAKGHGLKGRAVVYALSLATLGSAWTYFGAIGDASNGSWLFLANALGPIAAITLGFPIWRKIALLTKQENVGSLADFLAARYGKSRRLGILVACVASLGALPYIALQLTILTGALSFVTGSTQSSSLLALLLVGLLVGFAILFGARRPSLTEHTRGFVNMIAIEACVKLLGLLLVGGLCISLISGATIGFSRALSSMPALSSNIDFSFVTLTILCTMTAFTLPRQFHLGFVTLEDPRHIRTAAWLVPVYFLLWAAATVFIAATLRSGFSSQGVNPALLVLALPMNYGSEALTLFALLGGLSAGAAMVVVEMTAIAAMVSNELILPILARGRQGPRDVPNVGQAILLVRRGTILGIGLLAWIYYVGMRNVAGPTQLGVIALTASAQLVPALIGALYWRRGHAAGAITGIVGGMLVWAVAVAGPPFLSWNGVFGQENTANVWPVKADWRFEFTILASLAINAVLYVAISLRARPKLIDQIQANIFVSSDRDRSAMEGGELGGRIADLDKLLTRFLGREGATKALREVALAADRPDLPMGNPVSPAMAREVERILAGVVGAPSARNLVAIALAADTGDTTKIHRILDEAAHAVHFSRELLQKTLDALERGVGVVDAESRLIAWNANYLKCLGVPLEDVHVGRPLGELLGQGDSVTFAAPLSDRLAGRQEEVDSRRPFTDELVLEDGRVIRLSGLPLGEADYLTSFTDVTELKRAERILARSNEELEQIVRQRTAELTDANRALASANQTAERATNAQKRFVAAASHDLVQPLHAARLFIGNAMIDVDEDTELASVLQRADQAVAGAHQLLRALLNLSQLEIGAIQLNLEAVDSAQLLRSLSEGFEAQAAARGLELVVLPSRAWVMTDKDLLSSILQNLLLNAIRYTAEGRVVLLTRYAGSMVRFEVRDSGVGIADEAMPSAFREFSRLDKGRSMAEGAGLGLAIVARISQVLGQPVKVRSTPGRGSVFSVTVPRTMPARAAEPIKRRAAELKGLRVLCVDDEQDVLIGTKALIERWGGCVTALASAEEVPAEGEWDVAIADFHLGGENGLELLRSLAGRAQLRILMTAIPRKELEAMAGRAEVQLLHKPIAPLLLQATLVAAADELQNGGTRCLDSPTSWDRV